MRWANETVMAVSFSFSGVLVDLDFIAWEAAVSLHQYNSSPASSLELDDPDLRLLAARSHASTIAPDGDASLLADSDYTRGEPNLHFRRMHAV